MNQLYAGITTFADGRPVYRAVSPSFARMLGYEPEELVGTPAETHVDETPGVLDGWRADVLRDRHQSAVTTLIHRNGTRFAYAYEVIEIHSGDGPIYLFIGKPHESHEGLLTKHDVARIAQVSVRTVERWLASGALPAVRIPAGRRVRLAELEVFLARG